MVHKKVIHKCLVSIFCWSIVELRKCYLLEAFSMQPQSPAALCLRRCLSVGFLSLALPFDFRNTAAMNAKVPSWKLCRWCCVFPGQKKMTQRKLSLKCDDDFLLFGGYCCLLLHSGIGKGQRWKPSSVVSRGEPRQERRRRWGKVAIPVANKYGMSGMKFAKVYEKLHSKTKISVRVTADCDPCMH